MDWAYWLGLAVVLGLIELVTVNLVFLMLGLGAAAASVAAAAGAPAWAQVVTAVGSAMVLLAVVRPAAMRHIHTPNRLRSGVSALIGTSGVVLERVDGTGLSGRVRIAGEIWSARALDEHAVLEPGSTVDVVSIDGATAIVYPTEP